MNLVKWFRKNNKKMMAVVVIIIMIGFVGGSYLSQLSRRATGIHKTIAYFGDNKKITNSSLSTAHRELNILRTLRVDVLLRNQSLSGILLGELLFAEQQTSPLLINHIKQAIRTNHIRISDKQINDMYRKSVPSSIYWLLLKDEAGSAGIIASNEQASKLLGQLIPQLFNGQTYSQRIGDLINQHGLTEQQLLTIFSELLSTLEYAKIICSNENVTSSQIARSIAAEMESIDAELVEFDSDYFTSSIEEPALNAEEEHFEDYKQFFTGDVSEKNPHGFGYKLPDRVQLEYIIVKLDDILPLITPPANQEKDDYYQRYKQELFTEQLRTDPNDPNSPLTQRIKKRSEVEDIISSRLLKNKIYSTANQILQETITITEAGFEDTDIEPENLTDEQFKDLSGDYKTAAEKISKKHNIKLYQGQTGLLSPSVLQADEHLTRLYLEGRGRNPVPLFQIVFAVGDLDASELGPFDVQKPKMYENIGPLKDLWGWDPARRETPQWSGMQDTSGQIMAIARVTKAIKAAEPKRIDQPIDISAPNLDPNDELNEKNVYPVREKVTEDLKRLAAMDIAKSKAEEFIDLASKEGWDNALDKFNELYGPLAKQDQNDPNVFKLQNLTGLQRISSNTLETLVMQSEGNPGQRSFLTEARKWLSVNEAKIERQFIDQLYSLVPPDSNNVDAVPLVMEFKPGMSFYCIKNISVNRLTLQEYEEIKPMRLQREDYIQSESLAPIHFNPQNILKRMKFRNAGTDEEQQNDTPIEPEAAS